MSPRRLLLLASFLVLVTACSREESRVDGAAPSSGAPVIVISIDTLRADRLPAYGYDRVATPAIDALRADGILYRNAYAHAPTTLPSHVSLFTGALPYEHGVRNNLGYRFDAAAHETIPAMLRRSGYTTGGAVSAYVLRGETGLAPLFDFYDDRVAGATNVSIGEVARAGTATVAASKEWLASNAARPLFFFLHLFEPHAPYEAPEPHRSRFADPYDAEIAAADAVVAEFIAHLKAIGIYERALIVLLSDHGEGLGDHGEREHGVFLYREAIHVPLIVKLPGRERAGSSVDAPVQLIDVAPTIAAVTGAEPRGAFRGASLLGAIDPARRIYSETMLPRIHFGWSELRSLVGGRHHYIEAPRPELYDVVNDPRERTNIASDERRVLSDMRRTMESHPAALAAPSAVAAEDAEKLAALGYIGQTRETTAGALPDPKERIADLEELRRASSLERQGDLAGALALLGRIVERNPAFADAWFRLGATHDRLGATDAAIAAYRRGVEAAPVLAPQAATALASLYLRAGRHDDAAAHARLALATQPGAAHHLLGRIALARGDLAGAGREARSAIEQPLHRAAGRVLLARIHIAAGRLPQAIETLDEAQREAAGPVPDLEATRGDALARMNRPDDAERAFRRAIEQFPRATDAYANLAILYAALHRPDAAEDTLNAMYRAEPTPATAALAAGVWETVEQPDRATRWRRRAAG